MNDATDILLLANQTDKVANLRFLLRLANYQAVHISDDTEAFNYLVQRQNGSQPLKLLLIAAADSQQPILQLIDELARRNAMLPIILIRRNGPIPLTELACHDQLKTMIQQCDAAAAHSYLRTALSSFPAADRTASRQ